LHLKTEAGGKMERIYDIENIIFGYGEKNILKGIELKVKKGDFIGILGPNGCGKSTLLKNMIGYLKHTEGTIKIKGKSIDKMNPMELAKIVGFIPQKSEFVMDITVYDMIQMGRFPHLKSKWSGYSTKDKEITEKVIERLNLKKFKRRMISSLSGGEFQMVMLGRALVQEPEIILLDEATSNLDINHSAEFMGIVKELTVNEGLTAVSILHDINLASAYCTEIAFIKDGKIKYFNTPIKIIKKEILNDIYKIEPKIINDEAGNVYVVPA
jgi:iron complex transport system ATP-binding protein